CVGRLEDIPRRGDFLTCDIAGDNVLIVRTGSDDRAARAFSNVCRHHGTRLCADATGTLNGAIQCPYHAWTYDYDGRLLGAPHMDGSPGFARDDFPLNRVHCDVWAGYVFIAFAKDAMPLLDQLADLPDKFAPWRMHDLRRAERIVYDVAA